MTEKISISVHRDKLRVLKEYAELAYGGNLSAVIDELADRVRIEVGQARLARTLLREGFVLTPEAEAAIHAEQSAPLPPPPKRRRIGR